MDVWLTIDSLFCQSQWMKQCGILFILFNTFYHSWSENSYYYFYVIENFPQTTWNGVLYFFRQMYFFLCNWNTQLLWNCCSKKKFKRLTEGRVTVEKIVECQYMEHKYLRIVNKRCWSLFHFLLWFYGHTSKPQWDS